MENVLERPVHLVKSKGLISTGHNGYKAPLLFKIIFLQFQFDLLYCIVSLNSVLLLYSKQYQQY